MNTFVLPQTPFNVLFLFVVKCFSALYNASNFYLNAIHDGYRILHNKNDYPARTHDFTLEFVNVVFLFLFFFYVSNLNWVLQSPVLSNICFLIGNVTFNELSHTTSNTILLWINGTFNSASIHLQIQDLKIFILIEFIYSLHVTSIKVWVIYSNW